MVLGVALGIDNGLESRGKIRRSFNLIQPDQKIRVISASELHKFLRQGGLDISVDHSERITELISTQGGNTFNENELISYVTANLAVVSEREARLKRPSTGSMSDDAGERGKV